MLLVTIQVTTLSLAIENGLQGTVQPTEPTQATQTTEIKATLEHNTVTQNAIVTDTSSQVTTSSDKIENTHKEIKPDFQLPNSTSPKEVTTSTESKEIKSIDTSTIENKAAVLQTIDKQFEPVTFDCNLGKLENDNVYNIVKLNPNCLRANDENGNETIQTITITSLPLKANGYLVYNGFEVTQGQSIAISDLSKIALITTKACDRYNEFYYTASDNSSLKDQTPSKVEWKCGVGYDNDLRLTKYTEGEFQEYRKAKYKFRVSNLSDQLWKGRIELTDLVPQKLKIIYIGAPANFNCTGLNQRDLKCVSPENYELASNSDIFFEAEVWIDTESNGLVRNQACITTTKANENPLNNCSFVETFIKPVDLSDLPKTNSLDPKPDSNPNPEPKPKPNPVIDPEPIKLPISTIPPIAPSPIIELDSILPRTGGENYFYIALGVISVIGLLLLLVTNNKEAK